MASAQPSTAKRAQVQAAVLKATEELLEQGGSFADLKIERIATGAGISRTAFYFYFRDKRELLMRLCEDVTTSLYEQADVWFSGDSLTRDEVEAALGRVAAIYEDHGPLLRAITEVSTYDEELAGFWRALLQRFADATRERIESEQAAGRAPEMAPGQTAFRARLDDRALALRAHGAGRRRRPRDARLLDGRHLDPRSLREGEGVDRRAAPPPPGRGGR